MSVNMPEIVGSIKTSPIEKRIYDEKISHKIIIYFASFQIIAFYQVVMVT
jgi:hypothetical protein